MLPHLVVALAFVVILGLCSHEEGTIVRQFHGRVLGYVTPWNSHGYDVAKTFRHKFTHVSPVWYQLRDGSGSSFSLAGGHDVDQGWISDVRQPHDTGAKSIRIVPRFVIELHPQQHMELLTDSKPGIIKMLTTECKQQKYDGLVLEVWTTWHAYGFLPHYSRLCLKFFEGLAEALHKGKGPAGAPMELILAVPPPVPAHAGGQPAFTAKDFRQLSKHVDGFSLMTYDWNIARAGPNAPLPWVQENLDHLLAGSKEASHKVWLGLNFYGRGFAQNGKKADDILGHDYTRIMKENRPNVEWDEQSKEHVLSFRKEGRQHALYYPSKESIQARLNLAADAHAGISIWELGQGLDTFLDL